jgi:carboxyl-terminal processing protease
MLAAFWSFAEKEDFLTITADADSVNRNERVYPRSEREAAKAFVTNRLKGNLAGQLYGLDTRQAILNDTNPFFEKAMALWPASERLAAYHGYTTSSGETKTGR